jgi:hypothetical protein
MKTPQGIECPYFFGDYFRGRNLEECRLFETSPLKSEWTSKLCKTCPVPALTRANACENLMLTPRIEKTLFDIYRHVRFTAFCRKSNSTVDQPEIGCGMCHPLDDLFKMDIK